MDRKGKNNPNWKGGIIRTIDKVCVNCGKTFNVILARAKFCEVKFCSKSCYHINMRALRPVRKCLTCGKEFNPIRQQIQRGNAKYCSLKCRGIDKSKSGHHNWNGGITPITPHIKNSIEYKAWRQKVFIRDNFTCKRCGDNTGGNLQAHHLVGFSELLQEAREYMPLYDPYTAAISYPPLWDITNGMTLCKKCHMSLHGLSKKEE